MNAGFNPGSIIFPEPVLVTALQDAVGALPEDSRDRVRQRLAVEPGFVARLKKVVADLAISMMLAKSVDGEREFKSFASMVRDKPEADEDCLLVARVMLGYSRSTPEPQKGIPVYVKREVYLKRIDVVEKFMCGEHV